MLDVTSKQIILQPSVCSLKSYQQNKISLTKSSNSLCHHDNL